MSGIFNQTLIHFKLLSVINFKLQEEESSGAVSALNLDNVGGIFLVLLIGLVLGGVMVLLERFWSICAKKRKFI